METDDQESVARLLDQASEALSVGDWLAVREAVADVLLLEPDNHKANEMLSQAIHGERKSAPGIRTIRFSRFEFTEAYRFYEKEGFGHAVISSIPFGLV